MQCINNILQLQEFLTGITSAPYPHSPARFCCCLCGVLQFSKFLEGVFGVLRVCNFKFPLFLTDSLMQQTLKSHCVLGILLGQGVAVEDEIGK